MLHHVIDTLLCYSEFDEQGQYAISSGNLSALGSTKSEEVAGLFNELEWTPEQIDDIQSIQLGSLPSVCTAEDKSVSCK